MTPTSKINAMVDSVIEDALKGIDKMFVAGEIDEDKRREYIDVIWDSRGSMFNIFNDALNPEVEEDLDSSGFLNDTTEADGLLL